MPSFYHLTIKSPTSMLMLPAALAVAGTIWEGLGTLGAVPEVAIVVFCSLAVAMVRRSEF